MATSTHSRIFPFPLLCSSSRFTSNFLKATFFTGLQTEPYAAFQSSKKSDFASGRQPETHIFCREICKESKILLAESLSLLLLGTQFFSIEVVGENVSIIISYFSLMCFISFSKQSEVPAFIPRNRKDQIYLTSTYAVL